MKFNKTIKTQMVNAAITDKFEKEFNKVKLELSKAVREMLIKTTNHESYIKKLTSEELGFVRCSTSATLRNSINVEKIPFTRNTRFSHISFDNVYGDDYTYLQDDDCKEISQLKDLAKLISDETTQLSGVVHSYTKVKDLFEALPWIKKYYPEQIETGTSLVAKDVIDSINSKFGG